MFDSAQANRISAASRRPGPAGLDDRRVIRLPAPPRPRPAALDPRLGPPPGFSDLDNLGVRQRTGYADPERQLWCAVIIHTLYEAAGRVAYAERGEHERVRREAVAWFEEGGEDFGEVCDMAGLPPTAVRDNALKVINGGRLPRMRIPKAG